MIKLFPELVFEIARLGEVEPKLEVGDFAGGELGEVGIGVLLEVASIDCWRCW